MEHRAYAPRVSGAGCLVEKDFSARVRRDACTPRFEIVLPGTPF
jgi:hypothetical protein